MESISKTLLTFLKISAALYLERDSMMVNGIAVVRRVTHGWFNACVALYLSNASTFTSLRNKDCASLYIYIYIYILYIYIPREAFREEPVMSFGCKFVDIVFGVVFWFPKGVFS